MSDWSEIKNLAADLGAASEKTQVRASLVVRKVATDIQAAGQKNAPVGETGALRSSITTSFDGPLSAEIGPTVNYGAYVEFGTYKMSPRPYMGPAADQNEPLFESAMGKLVEEVL